MAGLGHRPILMATRQVRFMMASAAANVATYANGMVWPCSWPLSARRLAGGTKRKDQVMTEILKSGQSRRIDHASDMSTHRVEADISLRC